MDPCPSSLHLEQFLDDQLDGAESQAVVRHIDACSTCQTTLAELTETDRLALTSLEPGKTQTIDHSASGQLAFLERLKDRLPTRAAQAVPTTADSTRVSGGSETPLIEGYAILGELGRGGMGVVYRARQLELDRMVALKMILAGAQAPPRDRARFRQEAEAVARLQHPNIVQIYDIGEANGRAFIALEYINGGSLAQQIHGDPQTLAPTVRLMEQLARAVEYAHRHNVIHRDLKPSNVLLQLSDGRSRHAADRAALDPTPESTAPAEEPASPSGRLLYAIPKITDFGLAKRLDVPVGGTMTGEVLGTPSYMAPEQARSGDSAGPAVDVHALGAILYEMLTGRPPYKGAAAIDTLLQVLHDEPVRPSSLRPGLPLDLETICLTCLAKEPAKRYPSARALADDLQRFRQHKPIVARPIGPWERAWKWARRRPVPAALLAGIVAVTVLGFAGMTWLWQEAAQARDEAVSEKKEKDLQRLQAEHARGDAEQARIKEAEERANARIALYFTRIARSQLQWRVNDSTGAAKSLTACRPSPGVPDRRGWEWYYLFGLYHSELFTLPHSQAGAGGAVAFRPDGEKVASVVGGYESHEKEKKGELRVWDARTGILEQTVVGPGTWHRVAFRPDGQQIALAATDGTVSLRDANSGAEVVSPRLHSDVVSGLAYSPDGRRLATASWDRTVSIVSANTAHVEKVLRGHEGRVQTVAYHPAGKQLATGSWDATVKIWDVASGRAVQTFLGHKGPVYCVAYSPDGELLASAGDNGNLKIWDLSTGRIIQSLTGRAGAVMDIVFSPDARYLAYSGGDGTVRVWDVESGVERVIFRGHTASAESVRFSPDSQRLFSVSPQQGVVKVWDFTRHPLFASFARTLADVEALAFHKDGTQLVSVTTGGTMQTWDARTGVLKSEHRLGLSDKVVSPAILAAFSSDGQLLAARRGINPRTVGIWSTATGTEQLCLFGHTVPVSAVKFSPDGTWLASVAHGMHGDEPVHELKFWDTASGQEKAGLLGREAVFCVAIDPRGERVALGGKKGTVWVVDRRTCTVQFSLAAHASDVSAIAFSPDGRLLASAGLDDRTVKLWDLDAAQSQGKRRPLIRLAATPMVCDLGFTPDGRRLAAVSRDLVQLWDTGSGQEVVSLRGAPQRHFDPAFNPRLTFSPDGRRLAASNWDESISLWDADCPDDPAALPDYQGRRRQAADERAAYWHLQEAEQCLLHKKIPAAKFHLQQLENHFLAEPLRLRKEQLLTRVAEQKP